MAAGPDLSNLSHAQKDALIASLMAQVAALTARLAELEAKLGLPPKTPDNSSVPPSKGQKKKAGEATGDVSERDIRRIQIRETIKAHFDKEKQLFAQGIKVRAVQFSEL